MRFKISFDLVEDKEKQARDFGLTKEQKKWIKDNYEQVIQTHIEDIKDEILKNFTFGEYEYVENLEVREVENEKNIANNNSFSDLDYWA